MTTNTATNPRAVKGSNSLVVAMGELATTAQALGNSAKECAVKIKAVWGKAGEDDIRQTFMINYAIGRFGATLEAATQAYNLKWPSKSRKVGTDGTMNKTQFRLMHNAKQAWGRALEEAGLETKETRGGSNNRKSDEDYASTEKLVMPKGVKVASDLNYAAFCIAHATVCVDLKLNNETHKAFQGKFAAELYNAVKDHVDCLKAIVAKYDETPKK